MFFLHVIEDNKISEKYASEGLKHFKDVFDVELTLFPAYTPDALSPELRFAEFKVATNKRKLKHPLHGTEKACFCTHFELWKRCVKLNRSIFCFEHDARLNPEITEPYDIKQKLAQFIQKGSDYKRDEGIAFMGRPMATAYMISPEYARNIIKWVYKHQKQRRNINDPNSKGINMQVDTFLNEYHNSYMSLKENNHKKRERMWKKREVFIQDKSHGAIVFHGPNEINNIK